MAPYNVLVRGYIIPIVMVYKARPFTKYNSEQIGISERLIQSCIERFWEIGNIDFPDKKQPIGMEVKDFSKILEGYQTSALEQSTSVCEANKDVQPDLTA